MLKLAQQQPAGLVVGLFDSPTSSSTAAVVGRQLQQQQRRRTDRNNNDEEKNYTVRPPVPRHGHLTQRGDILTPSTQHGERNACSPAERKVRHHQQQQHSLARRPPPVPPVRSFKSETSLNRRWDSTAEFEPSTSFVYSTPSSSSVSGGSMSRQAMLRESELYQIELMYSGRASHVEVCNCLANLYFADVRPGPERRRPKRDDWTLAATGVPVLLLDSSADARARRHPNLQIILAEKGTGFQLWRDTFDGLTCYKADKKAFHTMVLSEDRRRLAGLSFDNAYSAIRFHQHVEKLQALSSSLTSDLDKTTSAAPFDSRKLRRRGGSRERRHSFHTSAIQKSDISKPCCFNHVTSLKPYHLNEQFVKGDAPTSNKKASRSTSCTQINRYVVESTISPGASSV